MVEEVRIQCEMIVMKIAEMSFSSLSLALDNFIDHKIHESLVAEKQSSLQFVMNKDHKSCGTV